MLPPPARACTAPVQSMLRQVTVPSIVTPSLLAAKEFASKKTLSAFWGIWLGLVLPPLLVAQWARSFHWPAPPTQ